jgi:cytochrome bd-type quinol oxidase subunit 2
MRLARLRPWEWIVAAGGVILLVSTFMSWYGLTLSTPAGDTTLVSHWTEDAWNAFTVVDVLLALVIITALALAFFQATRRSPAIPVSLSVLATVFGFIAVVAILFRIIVAPSLSVPGLRVPESASANHLSHTVEAGAWIGLIGAIAITAGGWLSMRTEGVASFDEQTDIETITIGA